MTKVKSITITAKKAVQIAKTYFCEIENEREVRRNLALEGIEHEKGDGDENGIWYVILGHDRLADAVGTFHRAVQFMESGKDTAQRTLRSFNTFEIDDSSGQVLKMAPYP